MPSSLPVDNAADKAVQDFGIGTYDAPRDNDGWHGEDSEKEERTKKTLPDGGGSQDPFGPDRLLSYPTDPMVSSFLGRQSAAEMPGDHEAPPSHGRSRRQETLDSRIPSVSQETSELPSGEPDARADYYDHMQIGQPGPQKVQERTYDLWADEDSGAWASERTSDSALPGVTKNDIQMDDFLSALGNAWSGFEVEDVSGVQGFPSTDLSENADFPRSDKNDGGQTLPMGGTASVAMTQKEWSSKMDEAMKIPDESKRNKVIESLYEQLVKDQDKPKGRKGTQMNRQATNLGLVTQLTQDFIEKFGKKDLTKRHVLAFLKEHGQPQFLSSDVIRCLKLRHSVYVKDVLDEFPIAKQASAGPSLTIARDTIFDLAVQHAHRPEVSSLLRRCAAALSRTMADMERLEKHG